MNRIAHVVVARSLALCLAVGVTLGGAALPVGGAFAQGTGPSGSAQPAGPAAPAAPVAPQPGPLAAAGDIVFTGTLSKATLPSFCQEETHYIRCTGPFPGQEAGSVLVKSTTLDLDQFIGVPMRFTCVAAGVTCLIYDITDATPATSYLTWCGTPAPGCPVRFRVGPTGVLGVYALFVSAAPGFVPLDPITGTAFLSQPVILVASGTTFGATAAVDLAIPSDPSWVGTRLWFQGVRADVGPVGPLEATDPACFTVLPSTVPCFLPGC
ncbi:hypothetical protein Pla163_25500 [Planctomycetes bacterium Pla163]|uniref:Uncharacterized protein n=1 Tax=Rohdeia mirabilis TaxID=2528008 RepID=A0A518D1R6_9BACT|nr:hypothetical protein Pla163_25500 [Planctomycetes bacterium Pla163]